jgi:hypothetical protein
MPRHRLPGIGEQVLLFVALPSSLPNKDTYMARVWFNDPGLHPERLRKARSSERVRMNCVSEKVYRKQGQGANASRGVLFRISDHQRRSAEN